MKSVYCAVRTASLNKAVSASSLKGLYIPLPVYMRLPSPWGASGWLHGATLWGVAVPPTDRRLCDFLAGIEAPYPAEQSCCCCVQNLSLHKLWTTDDEYLTV